MAAWLGLRPEEAEAGAEACSWQYDSTWEEEEDDEEKEEEEEKEKEEEAGDEDRLEDAEEPARGSGQAQSSWYAIIKKLLKCFLNKEFSGRRNWNAARDLQRYRHRYPGLTESENEEEEQMWNLSFYKNEICFLPQGLHIETLLELWWDNYEVLEENHSYIQWLFPLREHGMNWRAKPLTLQEIEAFKKSKEVMERFIRAYQLMLRFYGIILTNQETGELERAENWAERFQNLNRFSHNNLRITRILKCLGEMGYEHYQVHLVKFFLTETLVKETLPNVKRSALDYFLFTVRSKQKRRELVHYAWQHYKPQDSFVWGPHDKLSKYRPRSAKSQLHQTVGSKEEEPGRKCDDSVEESQNPSLEEAQEVLPKANEEDTRERLSESVSEGGDGDEKEALFTQQEENDFSSKAEAQGTAENDCAKESKKRKLDANVADNIKSGPLKSPPDIENISRNLGECALDAEISPSSSLLQTEEGQETLKEDNVNAKDLTVPETADAMVKRRKVDKRTQRNKTFNLAINLNMGLPARSAQLHPPVSNTKAEEEKVGEKKVTEEEVSKKDRGDANDGALSCPAASMLHKTTWTSPPSDGLESDAEQVTAKSDQHHCDGVLLGGKSEADGIEQHKKAANASEEEEAKATSKKQVPGSLEQNMTSTCPEQDSAELAIQETDSSELHAAEPDEEQVAE
uniref:Opioid growth factor receptor n=1 Tax=Cairina moschata TaxID=8855 RepID=A0A8C3CTK6_CAIMO